MSQRQWKAQSSTSPERDAQLWSRFLQAALKQRHTAEHACSQVLPATGKADLAPLACLHDLKTPHNDHWVTTS